MAKSSGLRNQGPPGTTPRSILFSRLYTRNLSPSQPAWTANGVTPGAMLPLKAPVVPQFVTPTGITSAEAFGTARVQPDQRITVGSITSTEAFGSARVQPDQRIT